MKFAQALKVTDAAARIARVMASLSRILLGLASDRNDFAVLARLFWLYSITPLTLAPHVAKRLEMTSNLRDDVSGDDLEIDLLTHESTLLSIIDEIRGAMEQPRSRQRRPDDTDEGRRPTPTDPRS